MLLGCRTTASHEPPQPPSPQTVSRATPGGDSPRPEQAALDRLLHQPWGLRRDRQGFVLIPLPDADNWKRVRFRMVPTLTGFRYGDDHHGVAALFVRKTPHLTPGEDASVACLHAFEHWGGEQANRFEIELGTPKDRTLSWRGRPVLVREREGSFIWWFHRRKYIGMYASMQPWPGRCATLAYAFPLEEAEQEARLVQERFVSESISRFFAGVQVPPVEDL